MKYGVGTKALFNSLSAGLVKVKVVAISKRDLGGLELKLRVTGRKHRYFHCGYVFEVPDIWVIPRDVYHRSKGKPFKFWTEPYSWKEK